MTEDPDLELLYLLAGAMAAVVSDRQAINIDVGGPRRIAMDGQALAKRLRQLAKQGRERANAPKEKPDDVG